MKISAVICEYNPFHPGHAYHISEVKKNSDAVIAVMRQLHSARYTCRHFQI